MSVAWSLSSKAGEGHGRPKESSTHGSFSVIGRKAFVHITVKTAFLPFPCLQQHHEQSRIVSFVAVALLSVGWWKVFGLEIVVRGANEGMP